MYYMHTASIRTINVVYLNRVVLIQPAGEAAQRELNNQDLRRRLITEIRDVRIPTHRCQIRNRFLPGKRELKNNAKIVC